MEPIDHLILRLDTIWGSPKTDNPDLFLAEYRRALKGYAAAVLQETGNRIIDTATFWPRPAELREIADAVAVALYEPQRRAARERIAREETEREAKRVRISPERATAMLDDLKRVIAEKSVERLLSEPYRPNTSRPAFEKMQRESPNRHLHGK